LDGRYFSKTRSIVNELSEFALCKQKVKIEILWLHYLNHQVMKKTLVLTVQVVICFFSILSYSEDDEDDEDDEGDEDDLDFFTHAIRSRFSFH
jgi:hypothetical protein